MSKQFTHQQLVERTATAAQELIRAEMNLRRHKIEIRAMYDTYFQAYGRPEGPFSAYDDRFAGVVDFTSEANERRAAARRVAYNARRRLERAVAALERVTPRRDGGSSV